MSTMELLMEMAGYGLSLLWLMVLILGGGFACVAVLGLLASADQWRLPKRTDLDRLNAWLQKMKGGLPEVWRP